MTQYPWGQSSSWYRQHKKTRKEEMRRFFGKKLDVFAFERKGGFSSDGLRCGGAWENTKGGGWKANNFLENLGSEWLKTQGTSWGTESISDCRVLPRSPWRATDTHQGARWQNALSINMLMRHNKTSPRAFTLHANFITAATQERRLCMQMRELSISKLRLVAAKCVIMDVGCLCCKTHSNS